MTFPRSLFLDLMERLARPLGSARVFGFILCAPALLGAAAQETADPKKCPYCKTTGKVANPFYEKHRSLLEPTRYSSWAIEMDGKGVGLPWLPCERCRNAELKARALAEFEPLVSGSRAWLKERRAIDAALHAEAPLLHLETEHFVWAWSIPELDYERRTFRQQDALFLYGRRMEEFYDDFQRIHRISDQDNLHNFHQIFCFERELVAMRACPLYAQRSSPSGRVSLLGQPSVTVLWWNKSLMPTEDYLHRSLIHDVSHLLTAVYRKPWWLYESGFAFEGSAHWWEIYYHKKASCQCAREINSLAGWVSTKWESRVKKAVLAGEEPSLSGLLDKNGGSLSAQEHIFCWSYIDYMMYMDPHKTLDFFVVLKEMRPAREAFMEIWGMSVLGFEQSWREYVRSRYQLQEIVSPTRRLRSKGGAVQGTAGTDDGDD